MSSYSFASKIECSDDFFQLQELFHENGWTDGLPVVPPTPEKVAEFLDAAGMQPSDVVASIPTRNRLITAEKVAINCVMAGCLPGYVPVVTAILQAMVEPDYRFHGAITSTGGSAPLAVVSGPIRTTLDMNSNVNVFGPGNRANAAIGRAVRLILINVAGAVPGLLDKSTQGHPGKFSLCIAENEEASPWEPLNVELGFPKDISTVTVFAAESPHGIQNHLSGDPIELLTCIAREVASIGAFSLGQSVVVLCPEHAEIIAKSGFTKKEVKDFIFQNAKCHATDLRNLGKLERDVCEFWKINVEGLELDQSVQVSRGCSPEDILVIVAGGDAGGHSCFIPSWSRGRLSLFQTKPIGVCLDCGPQNLGVQQ